MKKFMWVVLLFATPGFADSVATPETFSASATSAGPGRQFDIVASFANRSNLWAVFDVFGISNNLALQFGNPNLGPFVTQPNVDCRNHPCEDQSITELMSWVPPHTDFNGLAAFYSWSENAPVGYSFAGTITGEWGFATSVTGCTSTPSNSPLFSPHYNCFPSVPNIGLGMGEAGFTVTVGGPGSGEPSPVPEPGSWLLLSTGCAGMMIKSGWAKLRRRVRR